MLEIPKFEPAHVSRTLAHEVNSISFLGCKFVFPYNNINSQLDATIIILLIISISSTYFG
jgi:hypothetical protein